MTIRIIGLLLVLGAVAQQGCKKDLPLPFFDDGDDSDIDTGPAVDCSSIPDGPFDFNVMNNYTTYEDFAFDDDGNLLGMDYSGAMYKTNYDGESEVWALNAGCSAGLRALPNGDIVCNGNSSLILIDKDTAVATTVLSGLSYPNGLEVDLEGYAYVAEQSGSMVRRIDPYSGEFWILAEGLPNPNGIVFNEDYTILYVGSFGGGSIHKITFESNGWDVDQVEVFVPSVGTGALDGMGVDACGNVYICDYGSIDVYRISPDGEDIVSIVNLSSVSSWIPNMQWGSGHGGWDEETLYVIDIGTKVYEIDVGVPGKYRAYP